MIRVYQKKKKREVVLMLSVMGVMCTLNTLSELPETREHLDDARLLEQRDGHPIGLALAHTPAWGYHFD